MPASILSRFQVRHQHFLRSSKRLLVITSTHLVMQGLDKLTKSSWPLLDSRDFSVSRDNEQEFTLVVDERTKLKLSSPCRAQLLCAVSCAVAAARRAAGEDRLKLYAAVESRADRVGDEEKTAVLLALSGGAVMRLQNDGDGDVVADRVWPLHTLVKLQLMEGGSLVLFLQSSRCQRYWFDEDSEAEHFAVAIVERAGELGISLLLQRSASEDEYSALQAFRDDRPRVLLQMPVIRHASGRKDRKRQLCLTQTTVVERNAAAGTLRLFNLNDISAVIRYSGDDDCLGLVLSDEPPKRFRFAACVAPQRIPTLRGAGCVALALDDDGDDADHSGADDGKAEEERKAAEEGDLRDCTLPRMSAATARDAFFTTLMQLAKMNRCELPVYPTERPDSLCVAGMGEGYFDNLLQSISIEPTSVPTIARELVFNLPPSGWEHRRRRAVTDLIAAIEGEELDDLSTAFAFHALRRLVTCPAGVDAALSVKATLLPMLLQAMHGPPCVALAAAYVTHQLLDSAKGDAGLWQTALRAFLHDSNAALLTDWLAELDARALLMEGEGAAAAVYAERMHLLQRLVDAGKGDARDKKAVQQLLRAVSLKRPGIAASMLQLLRSVSPAISRPAAALLCALLTVVDADVRASVQQAAREDGSLLWALYLALNSHWRRQRAIASQLASLFTNGCEESAAVVRRAFPPPLYQEDGKSSLAYTEYGVLLSQDAGDAVGVRLQPRFFEDVQLDRCTPDLIWNAGTRADVCAALLQQLRLLDAARLRAVEGEHVVWNAGDFSVHYASLQAEVKVGRYYLAHTLTEEGTLADGVEDAAAFLQMLYFRLVLEPDEQVKKLCLKVMVVLYSTQPDRLRLLPFVPHLVHLCTQQTLSLSIRGRVIAFLLVLLCQPGNEERLKHAQLVPAMLQLLDELFASHDIVAVEEGGDGDDEAAISPEDKVLHVEAELTPREVALLVLKVLQDLIWSGIDPDDACKRKVPAATLPATLLSAAVVRRLVHLLSYRDADLESSVVSLLFLCITDADASSADALLDAGLFHYLLATTASGEALLQVANLLAETHAIAGCAHSAEQLLAYSRKQAVLGASGSGIPLSALAPLLPLPLIYLLLSEGSERWAAVFATEQEIATDSLYWTPDMRSQLQGELRSWLAAHRDADGMFDGAGELMPPVIYPQLVDRASVAGYYMDALVGCDDLAHRVRCRARLMAGLHGALLQVELPAQLKLAGQLLALQQQLARVCVDEPFCTAYRGFPALLAVATALPDIEDAAARAPVLRSLVHLVHTLLPLSLENRQAALSPTALSMMCGLLQAAVAMHGADGVELLQLLLQALATVCSSPAAPIAMAQCCEQAADGVQQLVALLCQPLRDDVMRAEVGEQALLVVAYLCTAGAAQPVLQHALSDTGMLWHLLALLPAGDGVDGSTSVRLAEGAASCLRPLLLEGGYSDDALPARLSHLFTPRLAEQLHLTSSAPGFVKLVLCDHHSPSIIWNDATRAELMDTAAAALASGEFVLPVAYKYACLAEEVRVGDVYVRAISDNPHWLPEDGEDFISALLEQLNGAVDAGDDEARLSALLDAVQSLARYCEITELLACLFNSHILLMRAVKLDGSPSQLDVALQALTAIATPHCCSAVDDDAMQQALLYLLEQCLALPAGDAAFDRLLTAAAGMLSCLSEGSEDVVDVLKLRAERLVGLTRSPARVAVYRTLCAMSLHADLAVHIAERINLREVCTLLKADDEGGLHAVLLALLLLLAITDNFSFLSNCLNLHILPALAEHDGSRPAQLVLFAFTTVTERADALHSALKSLRWTAPPDMYLPDAVALRASVQALIA
eukprot:PLAT3550.1.p1 GENE.PLAT3550.1~~PLAT3550.1.p1  ORF type:complete len:1826 (-),score=975.60 PLAT3550.1:62-5539(-)